MWVILNQPTLISIHAPREGGDINYWAMNYTKYQISIHAPREGGDNQLKRQPGG